jgi:hypothetical protein
MKSIPHLPWLVVIYFLMVVIPVYVVHSYLKKRAYANQTFTNLFFYFAGVIGSAFVMHSLCMWFYFTFFFGVRD